MADQPSYPGTPRWVKSFGIVIIVLVLLVVVVIITGFGGEHGPGRHMSSGHTGGGTPPASVTEDHTTAINHEGQ